MCTTQIDHEWVRYIPRKPKPTGVVYYMLSTTLTKSNKPAVFHLIPDVAGLKQFLQHRVRRANHAIFDMLTVLLGIDVTHRPKRLLCRLLVLCCEMP